MALQGAGGSGAGGTGGGDAGVVRVLSCIHQYMHAHESMSSGNVVKVSDDLVISWLAMMRVCNRLTQTIERELAREHQLCVSAYELMSALAPRTGWTRLSDLTEQVSRSQPQVSRLIAQMVAAGVVQRTASPDDGRGSLVRLTEAGRDLYASATATIERILRNAALPAVRFPPDPAGAPADAEAAHATG